MYLPGTERIATHRTYRKEFEMGEEHVRMLHDFVNETTGGKIGGDIGALLKKMEMMVGYMDHLQQAITMMSTEVTVTRAQLNMMMRMLIREKIFTEEEVNKRYEEEVAKPIQKHFEEIQKQAGEQINVKGSQRNAEEIGNS